MNTSKKPSNLGSVEDQIAQKEPLFGKCKGRFSFIIVSNEFAQELLPPDLELAPQNYTQNDQHPLLLMYNNTWLHSNPFLEKIAKTNHLDLNLHYNEFIVMMPYVQFKDDNYNKDGPYCFLPVLYLDSLLAVLGGRIFWEFNKEMAHFSTDQPQYSVSHEISRKTYLTSQFSLSGMPVISSSVSNFQSITPILELPVIEYGNLGYITSIYKVNYENAYIMPFDLTMTNHSSSYLPISTFNSPNILTQEMGSFNMDYEWSLTYAKFIKF